MRVALELLYLYITEWAATQKFVYFKYFSILCHLFCRSNIEQYLDLAHCVLMTSYLNLVYPLLFKHLQCPSSVSACPWNSEGCQILRTFKIRDCIQSSTGRRSWALDRLIDANLALRANHLPMGLISPRRIIDLQRNGLHLFYALNSRTTHAI